jgi:hypothetical protein
MYVLLERILHVWNCIFKLQQFLVVEDKQIDTICLNLYSN